MKHPFKLLGQGVGAKRCTAMQAALIEGLMRPHFLRKAQVASQEECEAQYFGSFLLVAPQVFCHGSQASYCALSGNE